MEKPHYPPLDEGTLKIIAMRLMDNPTYLTDDACPYHKDTVAMFVKTTSTENSTEVNEVDRQKKILFRMRKQLDEQAQRLDDETLETSAMNAYFRQRLNLEKEITALEKELHHIENVDAFFATVLTIMEDVLETDQRDEVMTKLRAIKNKEPE